MREVGAEQDPILAEEFGHLAEVFLPEGADVDVSLHDLDGVLRERLGLLLPQFGHLGQQRCDPRGAVFDDGDLQFGEAAERPVTHEGGDGVLDRSPHGEGAERVGLERKELAALAGPVVGVAVIAAVGGVQADEEVVFDDLGPERVELR